jgi:3-oxoacyl-[acyl-carrier protein] reductase
VTQPQALAGRVAVVTGAARGIGLAIADMLSGAGAAVALVDIDRDENEAAATNLRSAGRIVRPFSVDLSSSSAVDSLIDQVVAEMGSLEVLVNNAAITRPAMLHKMTDDDWTQVLTVNLTSFFFTTRAAARAMIPHKLGSIVNISALSALRGALGQVNYVSAKAGILGLTKASARELARHQVRVNAVTPGVARTRMSEKLLTDERFRDQYISEIPLGRVAEPEDIARVVLFLAGDDSSYMTGQVLNVSGGTYM